MSSRLGPRSRQTYSWNQRSASGTAAARSSGEVVPSVDSPYGIPARSATRATAGSPFVVHEPGESGRREDERERRRSSEDRRRRVDPSRRRAGRSARTRPGRRRRAPGAGSSRSPRRRPCSRRPPAACAAGPSAQVGDGRRAGQPTLDRGPADRLGAQVRAQLGPSRHAGVGSCAEGYQPPTALGLVVVPPTHEIPDLAVSSRREPGCARVTLAEAADRLRRAGLLATDATADGGGSDAADLATVDRRRAVGGDPADPRRGRLRRGRTATADRPAVRRVRRRAATAGSGSGSRRSARTLPARRRPTPPLRGLIVAVLGPGRRRQVDARPPPSATTLHPADRASSTPGSTRPAGAGSVSPGWRPLAILVRLWRLAARGDLAAASRPARAVRSLRVRRPAAAAAFGAGRRTRLRRALLARSLPAPDLVVVLDAPADVLVARRAEHPIEVIEAQRRRYRELAASLPDGVVLDAAARRGRGPSDPDRARLGADRRAPRRVRRSVTDVTARRLAPATPGVPVPAGRSGRQRRPSSRPDADWTLDLPDGGGRARRRRLGPAARTPPPRPPGRCARRVARERSLRTLGRQLPGPTSAPRRPSAAGRPARTGPPVGDTRSAIRAGAIVELSRDVDARRILDACLAACRASGRPARRLARRSGRAARCSSGSPTPGGPGSPPPRRDGLARRPRRARRDARLAGGGWASRWRPGRSAAGRPRAASWTLETLLPGRTAEPLRRRPSPARSPSPWRPSRAPTARRPR